MLHTLENAPGARKDRKRVGRGPGSTLGKTSGKGHKGQKARSGAKSRVGFEGGQMPLHRRLPKRGFNSLFKKTFSIVNLDDILGSKKLDKDALIDKDALLASGLIKNKNNPVKILGDGTLSVALKIEADKFSASAEKKIGEAGGTVTLTKE